MPARSLVIAGFNGSNDFQRTVSKVGEISRSHPELLNAPIIINLPSESEYFRWLDTDLLRPKSTEREKNYRACPFVYDSLNKKFYGGADDTIGELEDMVKVVEMHTMRTTEDQPRPGDSGLTTGHNQQQQVGSGLNTGHNQSGLNTGHNQQQVGSGLNTGGNQQQHHFGQQGLVEPGNNQRLDLGLQTGHSQQGGSDLNTGSNQQDLKTGFGQQQDLGTTKTGFGHQQDLGTTKTGFGHQQDLGTTETGFGQQQDLGTTKTGFGHQQDLGTTKTGFGQQQDFGGTKTGFNQQQDVHGMKTTGVTHIDASGFSRTQT